MDNPIIIDSCNALEGLDLAGEVLLRQAPPSETFQRPCVVIFSAGRENDGANLVTLPLCLDMRSGCLRDKHGLQSYA